MLQKPDHPLLTPQIRIPENCAFTSQHSTPNEAQTNGASGKGSHGMPNGGLQVINPCGAIYNRILHQLTQDDAIDTYEFADQSMLSDLFYDRWVTLPYVYNALKTLRWKGVHDAIWRDDEVKNVHMILGPKAWDEKEGEASDETHKWWHALNRERKDEERGKGIDDEF